ncbi:hypothetical protein [Bradyrhizobium sp. STM 3557]|uniref:hypothetical protein n=1 Tax=Bradyrhizobium sp. STM 3557 TaxID=578920 RepID=UPI00388ED884
MIIIRVELHSAITRKVTELARMRICNIGGTVDRGDYHVATLRGRSTEQLDRGAVTREGNVRDYPRRAIHVWHLVARALIALGYAGKGVQIEAADLFEAATDQSSNQPTNTRRPEGT